MRLYLDTNIVAYFLYNQSELSEDVRVALFDYGNVLSASTVCVHELIHLVQIGKVQKVEKGRRKPIPPEIIINNMVDAGIDIIPVDKSHLNLYATLPFYEEHRDPNDRLIIAQAISDKAALVSSDRDFTRYERFGLEFIFNKR